MFLFLSYYFLASACSLYNVYAVVIPVVPPLGICFSQNLTASSIQSLGTLFQSFIFQLSMNCSASL